MEITISKVICARSAKSYRVGYDVLTNDDTSWTSTPPRFVRRQKNSSGKYRLASKRIYLFSRSQTWTQIHSVIHHVALVLACPPPSGGYSHPHSTLNSTSRCGESASYYWGAHQKWQFLTKICWNIEVRAVQKHVNLVDLQ